MPKPDKHLNTIEFPVRWVDMDAYRHVSQTRYIDAMTETRAQWLRQVIQDSSLNQCFYYVAATQCNFFKAFKYPGTMRVQQYLIETQRTNFTLRYDFYEQNEEALCAQGFAKMVCVNPATERPIRIPENLHSSLIS